MDENKEQRLAVLDEYEAGMNRRLLGRIRRARFRSLTRPARILLLGAAGPLAAGAVVFVFVMAASRPDRYAEAATRANEPRFLEAVGSTGEFRAYFDPAIAVLREYPEAYATVVNTIEEIRVREKCPGAVACVYSVEELNFTWRDFPLRSVGTPALYLSPRWPSKLGPAEYAAVLVHEADHIEWHRLGRARAAANWIRFNPVTNWFVERPPFEHLPIEVRAYRRGNDFLARYKADHPPAE
jgi:hypothetical protein